MARDITKLSKAFYNAFKELRSIKEGKEDEVMQKAADMLAKAVHEYDNDGEIIIAAGAIQVTTGGTATTQKGANTNIIKAKTV